MSKKKRKNKSRGKAPAERVSEVGGAVRTSPDPALKARREAMEAAAYELFLSEGGGSLERQIEICELTSEAYESQLLAARDGGSDWGPTISPYENRMNQSNYIKLRREKNRWLADCRKRIKDEWSEAGQAYEAGQACEAAEPAHAGEPAHQADPRGGTPSPDEPAYSVSEPELQTSNTSPPGANTP